jgi:hypothetical protein
MNGNGRIHDTLTWPDRLDTLLSELSEETANQIRVATTRIMHQELAGNENGWKVYTLKDAYAPRPPVEYVVAGLFPLSSLSIVYGAPGTLKSLLLADMAACVVAGSPWLPPLPGNSDAIPKAVRRVPVLWCDFDNGTRLTHERMEALARTRDLSPDAPLYYVSMPSPWLDASDPESIEMLIEQIQRVGAKLVVIDNLGTISGTTDENSPAMVQVLANLRKVAEATGAAVVVIHHQRKSTGKNGRAGESMRGHSSIEAAVDLALLVERADGNTVKIRSTKTRGADVLPFKAMFTCSHRAGTTELSAARFFGLPGEGSTGKAQARRNIREIVKAHPQINKGDLTKAVKERLPDMAIHIIAALIDAMVSDGELEVKSGDRGAKLYTLPAEKAS